MSVLEKAGWSLAFAAFCLVFAFLALKLGECVTRRRCARGRHDTGWGPWEHGAICIDCGAVAPMEVSR